MKNNISEYKKYTFYDLYRILESTANAKWIDERLIENDIFLKNERALNVKFLEDTLEEKLQENGIKYQRKFEYLYENLTESNNMQPTRINDSIFKELLFLIDSIKEGQETFNKEHESQSVDMGDFSQHYVEGYNAAINKLIVLLQQRTLLYLPEK